MAVPSQREKYNAKLHALAVVFACVVFPLIWVGGLVTTTDAGMAVPDWPNTYGYNLFLYPIYEWFFGPWDLFVEHGHRLLASLAGLLAIIMVVATVRSDGRKWFQVLAYCSLGLVIFQGILGGIRVVLDDRAVAMIHGCVGPGFFVVVVALVVCSSKWWFEIHERVDRVRQSVAGSSLGWTSLTMFVLAAAQLFVGANLRHVAVYADPMLFRSLVLAHLVLGASILIATIWVAACCFGREMREMGFRFLGVGLILCVAGQIGLGIATWVVKFGWPIWFSQFEFAAGFVIGEKNFAQMNIVTGHVAMGSLILAFSIAIVLKSFRVLSLTSKSSMSKAEIGAVI